jgi:hypothetical protein
MNTPDDPELVLASELRPFPFVEVGLALARIRDQRLYRAEYQTFEAYCQTKWHCGRSYVYHLISAAQLFTQVFADGKAPKPRHESQLRPLMGLSPEQAQLAWERAAQNAGNGRITARLVKTAVRELHLGASPKPIDHQPGKTKAEQRRLIIDASRQLLLLLSRKAKHELLTAKAETLRDQIQTLFAAGSDH